MVGSLPVMNTRPTRWLVALSTVALAVAACAGDDEATAQPTTTPAATATSAEAPTTSPTEAPTEAPVVTPEPTPVLEPTVTPETASTASSPIGDPRPAPELAGLVLPDGSTFELASLQGEDVLIYFGYTHCPDVCPATLGELYGVFEERPQTQALFVSVDPERDTPEFLGEWTKYLPDNIHAVTGSPGAIRRAADNYGVKYARVETTSTAGYTMSHTAELYLVDENGQLLLAYPFGTPATEIVQDLEVLEAG